MTEEDEQRGIIAGQRIKAARKEAGLSQAALGEKIGVSANTIYRFEKNALHGGTFKLHKLCIVLKIDMLKVFQPDEQDYRRDWGYPWGRDDPWRRDNRK